MSGLADVTVRCRFAGRPFAPRSLVFTNKTGRRVVDGPPGNIAYRTAMPLPRCSLNIGAVIRLCGVKNAVPPMEPGVKLCCGCCPKLWRLWRHWIDNQLRVLPTAGPVNSES